MGMIFPTFYHINEYNEIGYEALPKLLAVSYPLVLWAPSGWQLDQYYHAGICPIPREQFIKLVEANHIHIIGRKWWFDKVEREKRIERAKREKRNWEVIQWIDGFDDRIEAICREREATSTEECSVRVVKDEGGWDWAENYLARDDYRVIDTVEDLITVGKVPKGAVEKSRELLQEGNKREAVKWVLRDAYNHIEAKNLAGAKVPFVFQNDVDFFRLIEAKGTIPEIKKEMVVSAEIGRVIVEQLADRITQPEHVASLNEFVGSNLHRELASWFSQATELANNVLPQNYAQSLEDLLLRHAAIGKLSKRVVERLTQRLRLHDPNAGEIEIDEVITSFMSETMDSEGKIGISTVIVDDIPIKGGISKEIKAAKEDDTFWPLLSSIRRKWKC